MALDARRRLPCLRNFGHCIISWRIENVLLALCNSESIVTSKEFEVSSVRNTRWRLGFHIESGETNLQMFLKRLNDEVDEIFKVAWKTTVLNSKRERIFFADKTSFFAPNAQHVVDLVLPLDILKIIPAQEPNEAIFVIQMIVFMNVPMSFPKPVEDFGLMALVSDMEVICRAGQHFDVTAILNGGESIDMHRAVVCPRSAKLAEMAGHKSKKSFKLYFEDSEAVSRLFAYFYAADLTCILDPPSISIYDCIMALNIKELKDTYPQEKVLMKTIIEAKKFEFQWKIINFTNDDEPQDSEVYEADGMDSSWMLTLYPKGIPDGSERESTYVYIEATVVEIIGNQDVYIDFRAGEGESPMPIVRRRHGRVMAGQVLRAQLFRIGGPSMSKAVVDNMLNISFTVHIATGKTNSIITETHPPVPLELTNRDTYRLLTEYLGRLQSDDTYSDITLLVEDQEFRCHKFLLAGRSTILSRQLESIKDDSSLTIRKINKHVFRVFLDYLYRGVVTDVEVDVLMQLVDTAAHFDVKSLKKLCLDHLEEQLTPENSCYLLIFAHQRSFASLKTQALHMISTYRDFITEYPGWRDMEVTHNKLFKDVEEFLRNTSHKIEASLSDIPEI